ncbi:putative E3 ubiquitin-protein ligase XBAT31 [Cucurbita moschata]|uniref:RING-type E3 ubiquitin transferase n=1 Tax=Cucurbita moschata TaxID=3662 RepID=A0A6J1GBC7_CUCMO|nr:putative E3 ubiquitin-protein ligase XBAT31 [Cucurbita moschata]
MGQGLSCADRHGTGVFFRALQNGDVEVVRALMEIDSSILHQTTKHQGLSALHVAAANGQTDILSMLLDWNVNPDVLNRHNQTPLMLAAMSGKIACVQRLIEAGANILMFDSTHRRTCLHYAAYYGHSDCLQAILSAAHTTPVSDSWGFARFVNIRDGDGSTPLHLSARQSQPECVRILLSNGALVCVSTCSCPGSSPLHLAARGGSLECVRELLAWGADRFQYDSYGRIPFTVALKHKHQACAALLNPSSPEPLVWPSPLKLIIELHPDAKVLLEKALMDANMEREKAIFKETFVTPPCPFQSDLDIDSDLDNDLASEASDTELCSICFEQMCNIEAQPCGHRMCAHCTLSLCCHKKPNPTTACPTAPVCPFCRGSITQLLVAEVKSHDKVDQEISPLKLKGLTTSNFNEENTSLKSLSILFGKLSEQNSGTCVKS